MARSGSCSSSLVRAYVGLTRRLLLLLLLLVLLLVELLLLLLPCCCCCCSSTKKLLNFLKFPMYGSIKLSGVAQSCRASAFGRSGFVVDIERFVVLPQRSPPAFAVHGTVALVFRIEDMLIGKLCYDNR